MGKQYKPFDNAEEVWFWFCNSMIARGDGLRQKSDYPGDPREIEIGDVYKIIKKMKASHQINNRELRVIIRWGSIGCPPYYDKRAKYSEVRLWEKAINIFSQYLKVKGIIP